MLAKDSTGHLGEGPLKGRGLGPCSRGLDFRKGFGRSCGYRFWQRPIELTKEEKVKILEAEKNDIEKALKEFEE